MSLADLFKKKEAEPVLSVNERIALLKEQQRETEAKVALAKEEAKLAALEKQIPRKSSAFQNFANWAGKVQDNLNKSNVLGTNPPKKEKEKKPFPRYDQIL